MRLHPETKPNVHSYNILLDYWSERGDCSKLDEIVKTMKEEGIEPV